MGRNAAGESFLRGYFAYTSATEHWIQVTSKKHADEFAQTARRYGRMESIHAIDAINLPALAQPGLLYYPGPDIGRSAWGRSLATGGSSAWSLCGVTHTTSSAAIGDGLTELLTAPVQPWDAVICTSAAVKQNVTQVLQSQADHLAQRLEIQRVILPQFPIIPLGIHTQDFICAGDQRATARQQIGADPDTVVVLYLGRLSFHGKAHPLAMYQALEKAVAAMPPQKKVVLVECGWYANDFTKNAYSDAAHLACPSVRVVTLDGRSENNRSLAWAAADIFCSLSDNIQESFGITPIEAMATGLPVIVSDWDGYKDTVRNGIDGFRVPTIMPASSLGGDLAFRHALGVDSYDMYCGHTSSLVAVDIPATAEAFQQLFTNPSLRKTMGEAGRQRAREVYDWKVIIPQYEALWAELAEIRKAEGNKQQLLRHPWPARMDPYSAFAGYPTSHLTLESKLALVPATTEQALDRLKLLRALDMVQYARYVLMSDTEYETILKQFDDEAITAAKAIGDLPPKRQAFGLRALVGLIKLGLIKIA